MLGDLPVESFLLEVTEGDFTEEGAAHMWEQPKLKEVFKRKLSMLATKYELAGALPLPKRAAPAKRAVPPDAASCTSERPDR